jgi:hypothetical protein
LVQIIIMQNYMCIDTHCYGYWRKYYVAVIGVFLCFLVHVVQQGKRRHSYL